MQLWEKCLSLIKANVTEQQFKTWFEPIVFEAYSPATMTIVVKVPSPFVYEYLEENFVDLIGKVLKREFGQGVKLAYKIVTDKTNDKEMVVESDNTEDSIEKPLPRNRANQSYTALDVAQPQPIDSQLNPQQTFENFIEGKSNKLSRSVAQAIADNPSQQTFNPLFLWGPSGVGKTHLVNALGVRLQKLYPTRRVLYIPAHDFLVQFTESRRLNKFNEFIQFYQSIEVLIVDDVHEFTSQQKTLEAFFHIFNHLHQNGRKIILTCDRPPSELVGMEERMLSRFRWGITVEMERPEEELRYNILMSKILRGGLRIPEEVVHYIAHTIKSNVRELEGAIHSLQAYSIVENAEITLEFARHVLEKNAITKPQPKSKRTTFDYILDRVAEQMGVEVSDILGRGRKADVALARQMVMYLASRHTDLSTPRIGTLLGGRSHTTVLHGVDVIADDEELKNRAEKML